MCKQSFEMAQYKYKCHMYDVYQMSSVEYPDRKNSYQDKDGNWILCNHRDNYVCMVRPCGRVAL